MECLLLHTAGSSRVLPRDISSMCERQRCVGLVGVNDGEVARCRDRRGCASSSRVAGNIDASGIETSSVGLVSRARAVVGANYAFVVPDRAPQTRRKVALKTGRVCGKDAIKW